MPRVVGLLGRSWLLSCDDFSFICPGSALVHILWIVVGVSHTARVGAWSCGVPQHLCTFVAVFCGIAAFWDLVVARYASRGAILAQERRVLVPSLLRLRLYIGAVVVALVVVIGVCTVWPTAEPVGTPPPLGWGQGWQISVKVCYMIFVALLCSQLIWHAFMVTMGLLVSKDEVSYGNSGGMADMSVRTALRWLGASDDLIGQVAEVLMSLMGDADFAPSDVLFGILLVGAAQRRESNDSTSFNPEAHGTLSVENNEDRLALKELARFVSFANGIYGCTLNIWGDSVYEGTSVPMLRRLVRACYRALPCTQRTPAGLSSAWCCCPPLGPVRGDNCFRTTSYALRRAVATLGGDIELIMAALEEGRLGTAPPFAVLCDHTSSELVITVRGSFSFRDIVTDVTCNSEPFDPLGLSHGGESGIADECFVHAGILACMKDIKMKLAQQGTLEEALRPGGKAHGYKVVCTGHSLGAGIAVLLALELRATYGDTVRYIGFEPPGCLSPRLARETQKFGWYSCVVAEDWIPRLNLRTLQLLREDVMDELLLCQHSKVQLAVHFAPAFCSLFGSWNWWYCIRRFTRTFILRFVRPFVGSAPLSGSLLRRRRLHSDADLLEAQGSVSENRAPSFSIVGLTPPHTVRALEERQAQRSEPNFFAAEMFLPGKLVVLHPIAKDRILCGCWARDIAWCAQWGMPEDFQEMLVSHRAVAYHFPHNVASAISASLCHLLEPRIPAESSEMSTFGNRARTAGTTQGSSFLSSSSSV